MEGYVQVYTGDGKGKTTASMGLALRALGAGLQVYFGQFMKMGEMSEVKALRTFPNITIRQYGDGTELTHPNPQQDRAAAQLGYAQALDALKSGHYHMVILDEINVAAHLGHIDLVQLTALLDARPAHTELIFTGRWAKDTVLRRADLISEIKAVKHYYDAGVQARKGIEF